MINDHGYNFIMKVQHDPKNVKHLSSNNNKKWTLKTWKSKSIKNISVICFTVCSHIGTPRMKNAHFHRKVTRDKL